MAKISPPESTHPHHPEKPPPPEPSHPPNPLHGPGPGASPPRPEDITAELEAIRLRVAERRRMLAGVPKTYNSTDLADSEWLLVELDKARGNESMTPAEMAELQQMNDRRRLAPHYQAVADRIAAKHGELTPDELIERDHLNMLQDQQLGTDLPRYHELVDKSNRFKGKP